MRTAQEHPETKERILDEAHKLILAQGYEGTTVDDICHAVGQTKGSFFHYFESKEDLAKTLLERYAKERKERILAAYPPNEPDPAKRLLGLFATIKNRAGEAEHCGCLMGSMAQEMSMTHSSVQAIAEKTFGELAQLIAKDLAEAKERYAPKASWDPKSVAEHFMTTAQGGQLMAKIKQDRKAVQDAIGHYETYIRQLLNL